ncbi:MAG TPA: AraC family transcriptional regulator [Bacilli bacterium]
MNIYRNERIVKDIHRFIVDHLHVSLTVTDVAKQFGYSTEQLNRIVKETTGSSPSLYIRSIKINQAKKWLENSEMTVTEIAHVLGYEYENNFSRMFQNAVGVQPLIYRNSQQKKDID